MAGYLAKNREILLLLCIRYAADITAVRGTVGMADRWWRTRLGVFSL